MKDCERCGQIGHAVVKIADRNGDTYEAILCGRCTEEAITTLLGIRDERNQPAPIVLKRRPLVPS